MTIEALSTLLLALTGPILALGMALCLAVLRPLPAANGWVALWLAALAIRFGKSTLNAMLGLGSWALNLGLAGMLLAPPALYLAVRAGIGGPSAARRDYLHLLPAVIMAIGAAWIPNERGDAVSAGIYMTVLAVWAVYLVLTWRIVLSGGGTSPRPLLNLMLGTTTLCGLLFVLIFLAVPGLYLLNSALFALAVVAISAQLLSTLASQRRERASRPPTDTQRALAERARRLLATPEVLADAGMTLTRAARRLNVPSKTLSIAINTVTGDSFTTLLNAVRIEEAQRQLRSSECSLESIAERCGFSSASAFHRTFRRHLNTTPTAWRAADTAMSREAEAGYRSPISE